jgi:hypothetical protein
VNALEITPSGQMVAACGYQHIRMYDLASANPDPVMNFEGVTKNVSRVGFHVSFYSLLYFKIINVYAIWCPRLRYKKRKNLSPFSMFVLFNFEIMLLTKLLL